jgi:heterodisulfide reductase subunit B
METPTDPQLTQRINVVLAEEELVYERDTLPVLHLLQVLNEPGTLEQLKADTIQPLTGLRVAPYYGCQILRPYACFDDPEQPTSMQPLLHAVGAELYPWQMGNRCCGASLITTHREVALGDIGAILHAAQDADVIVTVCPMCQMNLEGFQKQALRGFQNDVHVPILYLPQLLGLAVGLTPEILQINKNLCAGPFHKGIG